MANPYGFHQNIDFTHVIVRYDTRDPRLAVVVCYATSYEEAKALYQVFLRMARQFAPTALYTINDYVVVEVYQQAYRRKGRK